MRHAALNPASLNPSLLSGFSSSALDPACDRSFSKAQHGVAMVTVLWLIAAMSLLVAGQVAATRSDLRSTALFRDFAVHAALADGAIRIAARELVTAPPPSSSPQWMMQLEGQALRVEAVPASAFIDLNNAPRNLLIDMLVFGGGVPDDDAVLLADAILVWRDPDGARLGGSEMDTALLARHLANAPRRDGFHTVEDLMQVQGMDLLVYERVADLVTVHNPMDGVDPRFAPPRVLTILTRGDLARARRIELARNAGDPALDIADLPHAWVAHSSQRAYRISATGSVNGMTMQRTRWIALERAPQFGTPWIELSAEPVSVVNTGDVHDR